MYIRIKGLVPLFERKRKRKAAIILGTITDRVTSQNYGRKVEQEELKKYV